MKLFKLITTALLVLVGLAAWYVTARYIDNDKPLAERWWRSGLIYIGIVSFFVGVIWNFDWR